MIACSSDNKLSETSSAEVAYVTLPYKGKVGEKVLKSPKSGSKSCSQKKLKQALLTPVPNLDLYLQ